MARNKTLWAIKAHTPGFMHVFGPLPLREAGRLYRAFLATGIGCGFCTWETFLKNMELEGNKEVYKPVNGSTNVYRDLREEIDAANEQSPEYFNRFIAGDR